MDNWQKLSKKYRKNPFFMFNPVIEQRVNSVALKVSLYKRMLMGLVFMFFGGGLFVLIWAKGSEFPLDSIIKYVVCVFGGLLIFAGLITLLRQNSILLDAATKRINFCIGPFPFTGRNFIDANDVDVVLTINEKDIYQRDKGWFFLEFRKGEERIHIAKSQEKRKLLNVFNSIREYLGSEKVDETIAAADTSIDFEVEKAPLANYSAKFRTKKLVIQSQDVAAIKPAFFARMIFLFLLFLGLVALILILPVEIREKSISGISFVAAIGSIFLLVGLFGFAGKFSAKPVIFDRRQNIFIQKGRKYAEVFGSRGLSIDEIRALQICSKYESENQGPGYVAFELNVVLQKGKRINLMCHSVEKHIRQEAKQLSGFLSKPILDHS